MKAVLEKYDRLPKQVQAFQWHPDIEYEGITIPEPRVVLSQDGKHYFIEHLEKSSLCWLTLREAPGPVSKDQQREKPHGWVQFQKKDGTEVYHRKVSPFNFFPDIIPDRDKVEVLEPAGQLLYDYAYANEWEDVNLNITTGILAAQGQLFRVNNGDYIIVDGMKTHCLPANMFTANYSKVHV